MAALSSLDFSPSALVRFTLCLVSVSIFQFLCSSSMYVSIWFFMLSCQSANTFSRSSIFSCLVFRSSLMLLFSCSCCLSLSLRILDSLLSSAMQALTSPILLLISDILVSQFRFVASIRFNSDSISSYLDPNAEFYFRQASFSYLRKMVYFFSFSSQVLRLVRCRFISSNWPSFSPNSTLLFFSSTLYNSTYLLSSLMVFCDISALDLTSVYFRRTSSPIILIFSLNSPRQFYKMTTSFSLLRATISYSLSFLTIKSLSSSIPPGPCTSETVLVRIGETFLRDIIFYCQKIICYQFVILSFQSTIIATSLQASFAGEKTISALIRLVLKIVGFFFLFLYLELQSFDQPQLTNYARVQMNHRRRLNKPLTIPPPIFLQAPCGQSVPPQSQQNYCPHLHIMVLQPSLLSTQYLHLGHCLNLAPLTKSSNFLSASLQLWLILYSAHDMFRWYSHLHDRQQCFQHTGHLQLSRPYSMVNTLVQPGDGHQEACAPDFYTHVSKLNLAYFYLRSPSMYYSMSSTDKILQLPVGQGIQTFFQFKAASMTPQMHALWKMCPQLRVPMSRKGIYSRQIQQVIATFSFLIFSCLFFLIYSYSWAMRALAIFQFYSYCFFLYQINNLSYYSCYFLRNQKDEQSSSQIFSPGFQEPFSIYQPPSSLAHLFLRQLSFSMIPPVL